MKCVLLGDIGRPRLYHVGDEAMTEVAIDMLLRRGVADIVLAAANPPSASAFYGVDAVAQVRYPARALRGELDRLLAACTADDTVGSSRAAALDDAIGAADAVVIAGGGNMNSLYRHHLYERVTAARLAKRHSTPLVVSSQTVGPHLDERDRALTAEVVDAAELFGVRDPHSFDVVSRLARRPERIALTSDDAILLPRDDTDVESLPARYIAASFAASPETSGFSPDSYGDRVGALFDALSEATDADVLLVPHAGSLNPKTPTAEQAADRAIAESSATARVRVAPAQTARRTLDVTARSILSVSTRYHPTVFAPAHGVPAVGVALSHYSTVRMMGSLGSVGLNEFLLTAPAWSQIVPACVEAIERADEIRPHLDAMHARRVSEQEKWWDAVVDAVAGSRRAPLAAREDAPQLSAQGSWRGAASTARDAFATSSPEREVTRCLRRDLEVTEKKLAAAQKKTRTLRSEARRAVQRAEAAESRRAVRAANRVGSIARWLTRR